MTDSQMFLLAVGIGVLVVLLLVILLFKSTWRIAEPDEALIISGISGGKSASGITGESMRFKIVTAAAPWSCRACPRSAPSR